VSGHKETLETLGISLVILASIFRSTFHGNSIDSAVIPSLELTARTAIIHPWTLTSPLNTGPFFNKRRKCLPRSELLYKFFFHDGICFPDNIQLFLGPLLLLS